MKNARGALRIFLQFLKFGCFTFGGGLNIIAQMQRLYVDEEKRISSVELLDLTSVARSLPGLFRRQRRPSSTAIANRATQARSPRSSAWSYRR